MNIDDCVRNYRANPADELETWWENVPKKDGSFGKRWLRKSSWYCPLRTCGLCGKVSTPKKVQYRPCVGCWYGDDEYSSEKWTLCMGCWNKARVVSNNQDKAKELTRQINKLKREISHHVKNS